MSSTIEQTQEAYARDYQLAYRTAKYSDPCYATHDSIREMRNALETTIARERINREAGLTWPVIWTDQETAIALGRLRGYTEYLDDTMKPEVRAATYRQHKVFAHLMRATIARHKAEQLFDENPDANVFKWCAALKAEAKFRDAIRNADLEVGTFGPSLERAYVDIISSTDPVTCQYHWKDASSKLPSALLTQRLAYLRVSVSRHMRKEVMQSQATN